MVVTGRVFEAQTYKPLGGVKMTLLDTSPNDNITTTADTDTTAPDGSFRLEYELPGYYVYFDLLGELDHYYGGLASVQIRPDRLNNFDSLYMKPKAWLHIHAKNVNPFDSNDLLIAATEPTWGASPVHHYGTDVDVQVTIPLPGNTTYPFGYSVTKNGKKTYYPIDLYIAGHDTTYLNIFY